MTLQNFNGRMRHENSRTKSKKEVSHAFSGQPAQRTCHTYGQSRDSIQYSCYNDEGSWSAASGMPDAARCAAGHWEAGWRGRRILFQVSIYSTRPRDDRVCVCVVLRLSFSNSSARECVLLSHWICS